MSDIRWEGFTHDEIYARVQQGPGRAASADAEAAWSTVEGTIRSVDEQLTRAVRQVGVHWEGAAADGVHGGMRVMSNWALDAAGDALLTKNGIAAQAEEAGYIRAAMPPPRTAKWNDTVGQVVGGAGLVPAMTDIGALEDQMANDRARAVELMNQYSARSSENQQMMNYWTQPPRVVVETVPPAAPVSSPAVESSAAVGLGHLVAPAIGPGAGSPGVAITGAPGPATARGPDRPGAGGRTDATAGASSARASTGAASAVPAPPAPGPSGTARSSNGADRRAVPAPGPVPVVPSAGTGPTTAGRVARTRAGVEAPSSTAPTTGQRLPRTDLPTGIRPVVPGIPPRSVSEDAPGSGVAGRVAGRAAPAEPVPRAIVGAPPESPAAWRATSTEPGLPAERVATAGRAATSAGHGILPMGGVGRPADQEHRRPDYLIDDTDAFADDRWFTPPVIGGDDHETSRA